MKHGLFDLAGIGEAIVGVSTGYGSKRHFHDGYSIGIFHSPAQIWCRSRMQAVERGALVALEPGEVHGGQGDARHILQDGLVISPQYMKAQFGTENLFDFADAVIFDADLNEQFVNALRVRNRARIQASVAQLFGRHATRRAHSATPFKMDRGLTDNDGLSRYQRYRRSRAANDLSPHELRRMQRVATARTLIASGCPLAEAAIIAGFADQAHMTRQLRQMWGLTPAALRRCAVN